MLTLARLQADHGNRTFVPVFYRYLQSQSDTDQITHGKAFVAAIDKLVEPFEKHHDGVRLDLDCGQGMS